jgi:hypothetical protein
MRYTRKRIGFRKFNPHSLPEITLHRILNRLDVEKDALKTSTPIKRDRYEGFKYYADMLFGELQYPSYDRSYNYAVSMIRNYNAQDSKLTKIDDLNTVRVANIIPKYIKTVIQDAGLSPKIHLPYLQYLLTPGSYLDPASRSKGDIFSEFDTELTSNDFIALGMHNIHSMIYALQTDKSLNTTISFKHNTISVSFDNKFHPIQGDTTYFAGNPTKNTWFNTSSELDYNTAIQYILCKELGDTLQAYFGVKYMKRHNINPKELCLFTNDSILMMRCQLLQLQVMYNTIRGRSDSLFYHHPKMTDVTTEFKEMYKENLRLRNNGVIDDINTVLKNKVFYRPNGEIIRFADTSTIANILRMCVNEIQIQTNKFLAIDFTRIDPEDYRKLSHIFYANSLFTINVIDPGITSLFIKPTKGSRLFTPSFGTLMHGGGILEVGPLPPYTYRYGDFRIPYTDESTSTMKILHELFLLVSNSHSDWSEDRILYTNEQIYDMVYLYFSYHCLSIWDPNILQEIIREYEEGTLSNFSHTEFNDFIQPLMDTYLPPKDFELLTLEKYYSPKESDSKLPSILKALEFRNSPQSNIASPLTRKHTMVSARKTRRNPKR